MTEDLNSADRGRLASVPTLQGKACQWLLTTADVSLALDDIAEAKSVESAKEPERPRFTGGAFCFPGGQ